MIPLNGRPRGVYYQIGRQLKADHQVEINCGQPQREEPSRTHSEVAIQFGKHLSGGVAVLLPDHPLVGGLVTPFEYPFGGKPPPQRVQPASLARNNHTEDTARPQNSRNLLQSGWEIVEVFKNMDGENPIEGVVIPRKSLLAIGDDDRQAITLGDLSGKLTGRLQRNILTSGFELNVRTGSSPDLQRSTLRRGGATRKGVIESTYPTKASRLHGGQELIDPVLHDCRLFVGERRSLLGPRHLAHVILRRLEGSPRRRL